MLGIEHGARKGTWEEVRRGFVLEGLDAAAATFPLCITWVNPQIEEPHWGFPECSISKVRPASEARGPGAWAGSLTRGNPDGGKGSHYLR